MVAWEGILDKVIFNQRPERKVDILGEKYSGKKEEAVQSHCEGMPGMYYIRRWNQSEVSWMEKRRNTEKGKGRPDLGRPGKSWKRFWLLLTDEGPEEFWPEG